MAWPSKNDGVPKAAGLSANTLLASRAISTVNTAAGRAGVELLVATGGVLPPLTPTIEATEKPLKLEALSISFVVLPDANAKGCT